MDKRKKVGILTLHNGVNYGGILQCYALQQILRDKGYDVVIINFKKRKATLFRRIIFRLSLLNSYKDIYDHFYTLFFKIKKIKKRIPADYLKREFDQFRSTYLNCSVTVYEDTIGDLVNKYDSIIVGSDQVWTTLNSRKLIYLFDWKPEYRGRRLSYAACSAFKNSPRINRVKIKKMLGTFYSISVRDMTTQKFVFNHIGKKAEIVPDPTILHDFTEFITVKKVVEPYILVYILGPEIEGGHKRAIAEILKRTGLLKIVTIDAGKAGCLFADEVLMNVTPQEWVNLFANASFVYTDSFHGVIFSLKFKKDFIAYYACIVRSSRLLDLKSSFPLKNRIVANVDEMKCHDMKALDYDLIAKILSEKKRIGSDFIDRNLWGKE